VDHPRSVGLGSCAKAICPDSPHPDIAIHPMTHPMVEMSATTPI
jgi:hypothetical protein